MGIFCRDYEYCIPWVKIVKIGPDIILVNICESDMRASCYDFINTKNYKKVKISTKHIDNEN